MKVLTNINLAASFEQLKKAMKAAEDHIKGEDEYKYPYAYGMLRGAILGHVIGCTDTPTDELFPKAETTDKDDLKDIDIK